VPDAPDSAIDLISKLMTYDPKERLTAKQVLEHPFLQELYDPLHDDQIIEGEPVRYYDFEFEQYTINKDIVKELIIDEIIMANSKEARKVNRELREKHKKGVLEFIYERQDKPKKDKEEKEAKQVKATEKQSSKTAPSTPPNPENQELGTEMQLPPL
jgi:serine/threonine protein kinase